MNGRDKDQQQESLRNRTEGRVGSSRNKLKKDWIGRRILRMTFMEVLGEVERGGKRGEDPARSGQQSELFPTSIVTQLGDEACFEPTDETVAL